MKYQLSAIPRVVGLALLLMLCSAPAKSLPLLLDMLVSAIWGVDWVATNSSRAQLTVANELRLHDGYVEVESKTYDFSNADSVDLSFDVTRFFISILNISIWFSSNYRPFRYFVHNCF